MISGKITSDYIGKTVYLSNSVAASQEWRIADVNHDGTVGTVDLFPKYFLENGTRVFSEINSLYSTSSLRTWLNGDFYNGFTDEIKNAMKIQSFPSNYETLSDKVKCPSLNEVGLGYDGYSIDEGTIYPIFGSVIIKGFNANKLSGYKRADNLWEYDQICYWTRSLNYGNKNCVWTVRNDGYYAEWGYSISNYVVACIRF